MNACDIVVLDFLATHAGFTARQVGYLKSWWESTRQIEEDLAAFLLRQQLLSQPTVQVFRQISRNHLTETLGAVLVDRRELQSLRRRLPEVARLDEDRELNATVTLLSGDDTAKDFQLPPPPVVPEKPPAPLVGTSLGKYLLTECIGAGAAGVVFRAMHPTLHIPVAVKVLRSAAGLEGAEGQRRLNAEGRLLARLNHPNVVRVFDFEQDRDFPFLVLEFINGPSLAELIAQSGRIQARRVVPIMRQLVDALSAAHRLGIVHRDIKPANVLLNRDGDAKLADLGLATRQGPADDSGPLPANARVGTVSYLAPELAGTAQLADERSDIYALGATMFHALTGSPPFRGDSVWEVLCQHARTPPPAPRSRAADVPIELSDLVERMLAKDPAARPASFAALFLEPALNAEPVEFAGDRAILPKRRWRRLVRSLLG